MFGKFFNGGIIFIADNAGKKNRAEKDGNIKTDYMHSGKSIIDHEVKLLF